MDTQAPQNPNINNAPHDAAIIILRDFFNLHPQDPTLLSYQKALKEQNQDALKATTENLFTKIPTNPIRASNLYTQLSQQTPELASIILNCYQSSHYINQLDKGLESKAELVNAQIALNEAEIQEIRNKIAQNLEPELKASIERIHKLEEQIEQQKEVVDGIQIKVDAVADRLVITQKNLQEALLEHSRLDKEIIKLEDDDEEEEEDEGEGGSGSGDAGRLKKQREGQERIAELIQEEINHLKLNQKAASRELDNAKQQLATLEDMLEHETANRDKITAEIEEQKQKISKIESKNNSNAEEIANLEMDQEFIRSSEFTETFNAITQKIPLPKAQEERLNRLIGENAKSETLQSAMGSAHYELKSEQEQKQTAEKHLSIADVENAQQNQEAITIDIEKTNNIEIEKDLKTDVKEDSTEETKEAEEDQEDQLTLERDLAMETATDHAVRMALTMEAEGIVPHDEFTALMESLPEDLRAKVEPAVEDRLLQKGLSIEKEELIKTISNDTPTIFDPNSLGPRTEISDPSTNLGKTTDLRQAFVDSRDFKKFNAEGVEASYDTQPIKGVDPNIFQQGLNGAKFEPALENTGPALDQRPEEKPKPKVRPALQAGIKPGHGM